MASLIAKSPSGGDSGLWVNADDSGALHTTLRGFSSQVTFTRPANITAYAAGAVVGAADATVPANAGSAVHEFTNIGPAGSLVRLHSAMLQLRTAAIPAGMTSFTLHLYSAAPTAALDGAAWDLVSAQDRDGYLGSVSFTVSDVGSTLFSSVDGLNKVVKLAAGATSLFAELVTVGAHTPVSGMVTRMALSASGV